MKVLINTELKNHGLRQDLVFFYFQLTLNAIKAACQRNNKTIIARTIESTYEGSDTNQELLAKQRGVIREMKANTHG